jgi:hypothetical protein
MQHYRHQKFLRLLGTIEREIPAGKIVHVVLDCPQETQSVYVATHCPKGMRSIKTPKVMCCACCDPSWKRHD